MTNEELERVIDLEDFNRDKMKDDIHHLYEENKQLKERIGKAIEYIENMNAVLWNECHKYNFSCDDLLEILGDKE